MEKIDPVKTSLLRNILVGLAPPMKHSEYSSFMVQINKWMDGEKMPTCRDKCGILFQVKEDLAVELKMRIVHIRQV